MKIQDLLRSTRGQMGEMDAFRALLKIAANLRTGSHSTHGLRQGPLIRTSEPLHMLEAAAKVLNDADPAIRFEAISDFLDDTSHLESGDFWIRKDACDQILQLLDRASTVRFSYSAALRPCLTHAYHGVLEGTKRRLTFCSPDPDDSHLLYDLLDVLELGATVSIVTGQPWAREELGDDLVEIVFPPLGGQRPKICELPNDTLGSLGLVKSNGGRLSAESIAIADALTHSRGHAIISLSDGALFRMVGAEPVARRNLVDSGRLRAILGAPPGIMFGGTIIKTNLIIIAPRNMHQEQIRLCDLGHPVLAQKVRRGRSEIKPGVDWSALLESARPEDRTLVRDVDIEEIYGNNLALLPDRYLNVDAKERLDEFLQKSDVAELQELVDMIRPLSMTEDDGGAYILNEASPADVNVRGYIKLPSRTITVDRAKYNKASNQQLRAGDVLLSIKGNIGIASLVPEDVPREGESEIWTAGQSMMILRPKKRIGISSLALFEYLSNATVQEYLKSLAGGATIQNLAMKDLKSFPVAVPDDEAVDAVEVGFTRRQAIFDQIEALEAKVGSVQEQTWPHNQLKREG
ncbi:restriction endonuclease subunit S [Thalassorhabdomicrobium marinisediminis]|uniref:DNA methylase adenine-specific domain-containing protein n=1 Tax=Thalassorhabdomicrobium marinisediminis TaxID=2170577 RepID=A0A2T7FSX4_9RHOB|nr:restriction endonuclease subunit S [Thalassorhabdomicrobium marinisediminis]PVA05269.1 hypothetical protein DC363_15725 [Thalassorhabdomicrobium marinisediminis]